MQKTKIISLNIICILLLAYFTVLAWQRVVASTPFFDNDYKTFYISLHDNQKIYQPHYYFHVDHVSHINEKTTLHSSQELSAINMNTPTMNFILKGLTNISSRISANILIWVIVSLVGAGFSLALLQKNYFFPFLLVLWLSWPSLYNLKLGQVTFFVLPVLCGAFLLYQLKHERTMTILLGLLASLKIFFIIFLLLYIARRQWTLMGLFIFSFLLFFFLPLLYFPWNAYHAFFQLTQQYNIFIERALLPMNGSLLGVVANSSRLLHLSSTITEIRLSTTILCLYAIIRWIIFDNNQLRHFSEFSNELRFSFLIVLALLCSPLGWEYYFLFLLIPVVVLIKISQRYALSIFFYIFFTAFFILPYFGWMVAATPLRGVIQSFAVFAGLFCFLISLCCAVRSVRRAQLPTYNQSQILIGILIVCALINTLLLLMNYGMPYFLDVTQKSYLLHVGAVMQVH